MQTDRQTRLTNGSSSPGREPTEVDPLLAAADDNFITRLTQRRRPEHREEVTGCERRGGVRQDLFFCSPGKGEEKERRKSLEQLLGVLLSLAAFPSSLQGP